MIKRNYSSSVPVVVSGGILIAGLLWFTRMDWKIRGEDIAELRSAVEERKMAAWMTDPVVGGSAIAAVWCAIVEDTTGGMVTQLNATESSPLLFNIENYESFQRVDFAVGENARTGSFFEVAWYLDGNIQTGRMTLYVNSDPPGGEKFQGPIGDLELYWRSIRWHPGALDNYVRLIDEPADKVQEIIIKERISKAQVYDGIMANVRDVARMGEGENVMPAVFWLAHDVGDGDILCRLPDLKWNITASYTVSNYYGLGEITNTTYELSTSTNDATSDLTATTVTRIFPDGTQVVPYGELTTLPFSRILYSATTNALYGAGANNDTTETNWWHSIGNGELNYRYGCEDTNGVYRNYRITTNDLNEAANVITNLNRTIAILPLSFLYLIPSTNSAINAIIGGLGTTSTYFYAESAEYDLQEYVDAVQQSALQSTITNEITGTEWDGEIATYLLSARADAFYPDRPNSFTNWMWKISAAASINYSCAQLNGVITNYPAVSCLTNGMIGRVRVYACVRNSFSCAPDTVSISGYIPDPDSIIMDSFSGDYSAVSKAMRWSLIGEPVQIDDDININLPLAGPSYNERAGYYSGGDVPPVFSIWLLAEIDNPDSPDDMIVSFGAEKINWPRFKRHEKLEWTVQWPDTDDWHEKIEEWDMYIESTAECIAVVIDWNWEHMNPADPYSPTTYTPEWLSTNTP